MLNLRRFMLAVVLAACAVPFAAAQSNNTLLNGNYAFVVSGYTVPANSPISIGGTLVADSKGNITSGVLDINDVSKSPQLSVAVTGTYNVVSNYRATITLTTTVTKTTYSFIADLAGISNGIATKISLIEADSNAGASGSMSGQDPSTFTVASMNGPYVIGLNGKTIVSGSGESYTVAVGSFTVSGTGTGGTITNGLVDITSKLNGTTTHVVQAGSLTGGFTLGTNGRGTMTLTAPSGTVHVVFYILSAKKWMLISSDSGIVYAGDTVRQSGTPYTLASLAGTTIIYGTDASSVTVGTITVDASGNGNITLNQNDKGNVTTQSGSVATTLASAANGRYVINLGGGQLIAPVYAFAPGSFVLPSDDGFVIYGEQQTGGPFTTASLNGAYALGAMPLGGQMYNIGAGTTVLTGIYNFDGAGNTTSTQENVGESFSSTPSGPAFSARARTGISNTDTYSVDATGKVSCGACSSTKYIISPNKIVTLDTVQSIPIMGLMQAVGSTPEFTPKPGWWWDPNLSGIGFFVEYGGNSLGGIFMAGFLYDGSGNATWLVSTGAVQDTTYPGTWLNVKGGQQLLSTTYVAPASNSPAGSASIAFKSQTTGVMTRPDGSTINLQRFSFTTNPIPAPVSGAPQVGWWWADPTGSQYGKAYGSGTGFGIEFQNNSVFIVAYVYDASGNPVWYLSLGSLTTPTTYTGTWDLYGNGPQLTSPEGTYSAKKLSTATPMSLSFTSNTKGTLTMGNITIPIVRFQGF